MTKSHGYTYDVEPDADRVTVYRPNGNKAWFYDGRQLRNGGYDTLGDYAKFLDCVGYKRRDSITFPSGASVITAGDKIVARVEPEPKRPALTWNTKTPFDAFAGWEPVTSGFEDYAAPEQNHPLQRVSDASKPAHASAYLLG